MSPDGRHSGESPLPLYGLTGRYSGDRFIEGEGWDLQTIVHRSEDSQRDIVVGVVRRTTAQHTPRVAISEELARRSVATALVVDLPHVGDDVFEIADEVAHDGDAWKRRDVKLDGEVTSGHEREYKGMWIAYCLTPALIVHVLAAAALRLDKVELRRLEPDEVARRTDWPS